jgi:hypothetical protein
MSVVTRITSYRVDQCILCEKVSHIVKDTHICKFCMYDSLEPVECAMCKMVIGHNLKGKKTSDIICEDCHSEMGHESLSESNDSNEDCQP